MNSQGAADDWRACHDWVDGSGAVDIDVIEQEFGGASVWATDTTRHALLHVPTRSNLLCRRSAVDKTPAARKALKTY